MLFQQKELVLTTNRNPFQLNRGESARSYCSFLFCQRTLGLATHKVLPWFGNSCTTTSDIFSAIGKFANGLHGCIFPQQKNGLELMFRQLHRCDTHTKKLKSWSKNLTIKNPRKPTRFNQALMQLLPSSLHVCKMFFGVKPDVMSCDVLFWVQNFPLVFAKNEEMPRKPRQKKRRLSLCINGQIK